MMNCGFGSRIYRTRLAITDAGNEVLNDTSDFIEMNGTAHWLGGVHLRPANLWRWNEAAQEISARPLRTDAD
jgi:hypothetical protein